MEHLLIASVYPGFIYTLCSERTCLYLQVCCKWIPVYMRECLGAAGRVTCLYASYLTSSCPLQWAMYMTQQRVPWLQAIGCTQIWTYGDVCVLSLSVCMCVQAESLNWDTNQQAFSIALFTWRLLTSNSSSVTQSQVFVWARREERSEWNVHNCVNDSSSCCCEHKHVSHDNMTYTLNTLLLAAVQQIAPRG